ncbi:type I-U CRISPR-associated RAMP protein Csb1/Cas7u [Nocardia sp. CDC159]|uniref:Type I-U CRISPR-associated RAMP protein Csb1/Cas7u n=1 Tax=Nocardia pulmonis TaxID=2951408 RepID=A0A9X2E648_9NOCA|nr:MULTISPECIES: type I-U CRISPR-associated RAMP protein Csb1/Cas7u [Nocardia]MCM6774514.1 type I-U CRISPR-associated RAMP protein Csb1/Cas7u [Nocardia pulmonis]MCM6787420.1 type I-U CRISPR-associated RAMP protein Csb1/Cas7u [Nocardia sp. CDC159]
MSDIYDRLVSAVTTGDEIAAISIQQRLTPLPLGGRVYPPTFGSGDYLIHKHVVDGESCEIVVLDQPASQANRVESELEDAVAAGRITYPRTVIVDTVAGKPLRLSTLQLPHRFTDAYLQYSLVDGQPFDKSVLGKALRDTSTDDLSPLFAQDPASILYGVWDSRRPGARIKIARSYVSEVYGVDPQQGHRFGTRMDPLNLQGGTKSRSEHGFEFDAGTNGSKSGKKSDDARLSPLGLGNIPPSPAHGGVGIAEARRVANVTVAGMRRLRFGGRPGSGAARVALVALAMFGDRLAFGGAAMWLRSGCELTVVQDTVALVSRGGGTEPVTLSASNWAQVYERAIVDAAAGGVPLRSDVVELVPSAGLHAAFEYSVTKAAQGDE